MIKFRTGDILEADVDAVVNTVNCVGVMGRGIALQFKNTFPENFRAYAAACARNEVQPGKMFVYETGVLSPRYVINFPTKRHWKGKSRIEDIEVGLADLSKVVNERKIRSIAIPPLGSGLGGLNWSEVRPRIIAAVEHMPPNVAVVIYEPSGAPDSAALARNRKVPHMTAGRAALVVLMQRYLNGLMDPFVTLLEVHKLMFFLQEAGEQLRLTYRKANYGPYAENLRHVLSSIEGHLVAGYSDGGDDPAKRLNLVPGAYEDADRFLTDQTKTRERFDRVAKLLDGFETPYGLELLSTVYWVAKNEGARTLLDVQSKFYEWNVRKKLFAADQIALALNVLIERGWLEKIIHVPSHREASAPSAAAISST
ncbi:macro domain-containing protein [Ferrovibrio sp.]|uniref:type II toxin-antitoxin system antitoxin DNA ADP-ribosyl glycohydrolase DarG n=1 Tax=Ferrovibrio sp. TaxID=1917215 RepID=UPI0025BB5A14|nr:macro domain-containing protein [Ferrovibrio sp.]MBX3456324.1 macro domain-containing protein [Ferrovibrio sp.]